MKTIIAGSRTITDLSVVDRAIADSGFVITEVVSGGAAGVDTLGFNWAWSHGVPCRTFTANWKKHGKAAGPIRNQLMADYAEALIAVWDGKSLGTADMISRAHERGLKVFTVATGLDFKP